MRTIESWPGLGHIKTHISQLLSIKVILWHQHRYKIQFTAISRTQSLDDECNRCINHWPTESLRMSGQSGKWMNEWMNERPVIMNGQHRCIIISALIANTAINTLDTHFAEPKTQLKWVSGGVNGHESIGSIDGAMWHSFSATDHSIFATFLF